MVDIKYLIHKTPEEAYVVVGSFVTGADPDGKETVATAVGNY